MYNGIFLYLHCFTLGCQLLICKRDLNSEANTFSNFIAYTKGKRGKTEYKLKAEVDANRNNSGFQ